MQIGRLSRRITVQQYTWVEDEWGEPIQDWIEFAKLWAQIESASGNKFWDAEKYNSEVTHIITIRYLPELEYGMRILFSDRTGQREFKIEYFYHDEGRRRNTVIQVSEVLSDE